MPAQPSLLFCPTSSVHCIPYSDQSQRTSLYPLSFCKGRHNTIILADYLKKLRKGLLKADCRHAHEGRVRGCLPKYWSSFLISLACNIYIYMAPLWAITVTLQWLPGLLAMFIPTTILWDGSLFFAFKDCVLKEILKMSLWPYGWAVSYKYRWVTEMVCNYLGINCRERVKCSAQDCLPKAPMFPCVGHKEMYFQAPKAEISCQSTKHFYLFHVIFPAAISRPLQQT